MNDQEQRMLDFIEYDIIRSTIRKNTSNHFEDDFNLQNVYSPENLVEAMIEKLNGLQPLNDDLLYLVFNLEFLNYLVNIKKINPEKIIFCSDSRTKMNWADKLFVGLYLTISYDTLDTLININKLNNTMKFDVIIGNPPYQSCKEGNKKTQPIWQNFVEKAFNLCKEGGHVCMVHPSGWRNVDGVFKKTQELLNSKQIEYLEMHDLEDGRKTFGAATRYDWYVVKNVPNNEELTEVKFQDGTIDKVNLNELDFIPSAAMDEISKLIAKDGEEKVELLYNSTAYHTQKPHMAKEKEDKFQYPCVMNVNNTNEVSCVWYSNTNQNGHFGIKKAIFGRFGVGIFIDEVGTYGISQDCCGIIDTIENLENVKKAMQSDKFIELSKCCDVGGLGTLFNRKIISLFRKDFWKDFI